MDFGSIGGVATNIPVDWFIIGVFTLLFAFDTWKSGSGRACAIALALPIAMILTEMLSETFLLGTFVGELTTPILGAIIFFIFFAALYLLMRRIDSSYGGESGRPLQAILIGFACAAIFVVIWLEVPALSAVWKFNDATTAIFGEAYRFWWLLGSYATLAFVRR